MFDADMEEAGLKIEKRASLPIAAKGSLTTKTTLKKTNIIDETYSYKDNR